jgi:hypothetical protein
VYQGQNVQRKKVLLCGTMVGEMVKTLVIEKTAKSRLFKNLKSNNLPMIWRNSKKAWMTEERLNMFNAKIRTHE